jgi:N-acetylmuramic acid 6-phosphate (MurNAc-6-P) etherase
MMPSSITELSNELSDSIDIANPYEIVKILRSCDGQLFCGFKGYDSIYDFQIINVIHQIVNKCKAVLQSAEGKIVLSGAGTSGRLGFFLVREFNNVLNKSGHRKVFEYLIAGKDQALVKAQENTGNLLSSGMLNLRG